MMLARREHSRLELQRKLLPFARAAAIEREQKGHAQADESQRDPGDESGRLSPPSGEPAIRLRHQRRDDEARGSAAEAAAAEVAALLDWLEAQGYLSEQRFVESRVHARASRYGNLRIRSELAQHGVELDDATERQLRETELERARSAWRRRFGELPTDATERARQARFLAARGFASEIIRKVLRSADED